MKLTRRQRIFIAQRAVYNSVTQEQFLRAMRRLRRLQKSRAK